MVADSDKDARRIAAAAYPRWRSAMEYLWQRSGTPFPLKDIYPLDYAALESIGHGIAGTPATVRGFLARMQQDTGVNTVLCQTMFGDMRFEDAARSIELLGSEVMPAFK